MVAQDIAQLPAAKYWHDPILIVGANPVGLITALGLARYKIPSVVLDEGEGVSLESNQVALLDATTLSILDAWENGLGQFVASQGLIPAVERVFLRASQLYSAALPAHLPGSGYPQQVTLHHAALEQLLLQALQQIGGCQVLWQHRVKGFTHDHSGIDVELESPAGAKFLRAPYLLVTSDTSNAPDAAPGANQTVTTGSLAPVAQSANKPSKHDERYLSVDVLTELESVGEQWFWLDAPFNPGHITQLFSLPGGLVRILYQLGPRDDSGQQAEALQRRIEATLRGHPFEVIAISSHTRKRGVIEQFKEKRTLFLGSAAHHVALFGASEVNSGALDAWNLVWKLALVRAGLAMQDLLETYHLERHRAVIDYMKRTKETLAFVAPTSGLATWKRDTTLRLSHSFKSMRDSMRLSEARGASGSIAQADSPIFSDDNRLYLGGRFTRLTAEQNSTLKRFRQGPRVGMLAPSLALPDADTGAMTPLLGRVSSGFLALCFTNDIDMAMNMLRRIPVEMSGVPILFYLITPTIPAASAEDGITMLVDAQGRVARAYNAGQRSLYLVRPDGVIAARRFDSDFHDIPALLRHAIGEDVVDSQVHIPRPEMASSGS
ncbi:MAG TPA: FAD-dependent monooxygenase [Ktedonobacteraceae bacterium]|nr:FAD-dependent monooxygenase [Ktedonobacteraceae bacterium]